jgi:hypothetical protein
MLVSIMNAVVLLPDLTTTRIKDMVISYENGQELLRFSNGIANIGNGPLYAKSKVYLSNDSPDSNSIATQYLFDENGMVAANKTIGVFEFHHQHNHWHVGKIALYRVFSKILTILATKIIGRRKRGKFWERSFRTS